MDQLKRHVCSLELAEKLNKLDVKVKPYPLWWWEKKLGKWRVAALGDTTPRNEIVPALIAAELGEKLPKIIRYHKIMYWLTIAREDDGDCEYWAVYYYNMKPLMNGKKFHPDIPIQIDVKMADVLAKMLIYLIKNGFIKMEE